MCINPYIYSKLSGCIYNMHGPITYISKSIPYLKLYQCKQFYKIHNYSIYKYLYLQYINN